MAGGEVCKEVFYLAVEPAAQKVRLDLPSFDTDACCFTLPVFAETIGTDEFKNDNHSILKRYDKNIYSLVYQVLQKYEGGEWIDKAILTNDDYGTVYVFGLLKDSLDTLNYVGYQIEWQKVLIEFGEGSYRFKYEETKHDLSTDESFYQFEFCLKNYTPYAVDNTTRFTWYTKGFRGDSEDDLNTWDFEQVAEVVGGKGWFNQMRFPDSFFGGNKSSYEHEYVRYENGQQVWTKNEQIESYKWRSGHYPANLHDWIKTNILQADTIIITDYTGGNPNVLSNKYVNHDGNYEPNWRAGILNAYVSVDFVQAFQNRIKKRC